MISKQQRIDGLNNSATSARVHICEDFSPLLLQGWQLSWRDGPRILGYIQSVHFMASNIVDDMYCVTEAQKVHTFGMARKIFLDNVRESFLQHICYLARKLLIQQVHKHINCFFFIFMVTCPIETFQKFRTQKWIFAKCLNNPYNMGVVSCPTR